MSTHTWRILLPPALLRKRSLAQLICTAILLTLILLILWKWMHLEPAYRFPEYAPVTITDHPPYTDPRSTYVYHFQATDKPQGYTSEAHQSQRTQSVLILTPLKDAKRSLSSFFSMLESLAYPKHLISIGLLVSDSTDGTEEFVRNYISNLLPKGYHRVTLVRRDYAFALKGQDRHAYELQAARRSVMAKSRNYLVHQALDDEQWVLWIDSDLEMFPATLIQDLLSYNKTLLVPNCLWKSLFGCFYPYDRNSWQDTPESKKLVDKLIDTEVVFEGYEVNTHRRMLGDMRGSAQDVVELDGVGGTVLLVLADLHRDGLHFPVAPYKHTIETEGLAQMAQDMGVRAYGLPNYVILH